MTTTTNPAATFEPNPRAVAGDNKPPKARKLFTRVCPECCVEHKTPAKDGLFCSPAHKAAFHNRISTIGRGGVVALAQAWRLGRNVKGKTPEADKLRAIAAAAFDQMCRQLDAANTDDREAGRMSKLTYVAGKLARDLNDPRQLAEARALATAAARTQD